MSAHFAKRFGVQILKTSAPHLKEASHGTHQKD